MRTGSAVGDERGVEGVADVAGASFVMSGVCTGDVWSVACPHEVTSSNAMMVVAMASGAKKCRILLER